jgi:hypothetical protein
MSTGAAGAATTFSVVFPFLERGDPRSATIVAFSSGVASFIMERKDAAVSTGVGTALLDTGIAEAEAIADC